MATIYNSKLTQEIIEGARIQTSHDQVPSQLAEKVIPVMEVNPKLLRRCNIVRTGNAVNASSATIYTTPTDKDFYLTSCTVSVIKDATSTSLYSRIQFTVDGQAQNVCWISSFTLTAQDGQLNMTFPNPIKIDRGTNILINNSTNVANISSAGSIVGYTIDNINA